VLNIKNLKRFGRALNNSGGKANRLSAVKTLWVMTAILSHAPFAPNLPQGITPAPSSFLITSWIASIVPAFCRCQSISFSSFQSHMLVTIAKCLT